MSNVFLHIYGKLYHIFLSTSLPEHLSRLLRGSSDGHFKALSKSFISLLSGCGTLSSAVGSGSPEEICAHVYS